jgi:NADPH:quinone reductase-like Zn-dependent oxidoreductase
MAAVEQSFRVEMSKPGILEDLCVRPFERRAPGPDEVEIGVRSVGLNFAELLKAMGAYPGNQLDTPDGEPVTFGGDCAGTVLSVGSTVTRFRPGDRVVAYSREVFSSHTTLPEVFVAPIPAHIEFDGAATIPVAFVTAFYALYHQARIRRGESVLIHAAAGGVGLAAVQLCQLAGAEIWATAGRDEKREFLRAMGVPHVMSSRSMEFVDEIRKQTGGRGVNVILNSLSGECLSQSLGVLAPFGRFLEIGKRDIYEDRQLGLYPFRNNLTFYGIDLLQASPEHAGALFTELMGYFERNELQPLPHRVFPVSEIVTAFRHMRKAAHIGKIVIRLVEEE